MLRRYPSLLTLLGILLVASGCFRGPRLQDAPRGEVEMDDKLIFAFNRNMVDEKDVDLWKTETYFRFEPPIEGVYTWTDRRTLRFSPAQALDGAQTFKAYATGALPGVDSSNFEPVEFHTAAFRPRNIAVQWRDESFYSWHDAPVTATLNFNYEVDPDTLREYLVVARDGRPVEDISFYSYQAGTALEVVMDAEHYSDVPVQFKFMLRKGLAPSFGRSPLKEDTVITVRLAPIKVLEITDVYQQGSNYNPYYLVSANQPFDVDVLKQKLHFIPEVKYTIEHGGNQLRVYGDFNPDSRYTMVIDSGAKGLAGGVLGKEWRYTIDVPKLEPFVRFEDPARYYLLRNGLENVRVKSQGVGSYVVRLYEVYENNLVHFINDNYELFSDYVPSDEDEYYNDYSYGPDIDDYGRLLSEDTVKLPAAVGLNKKYSSLVHLKKQLRSRYKGIFVMELLKPGDYWSGDSKVISLSDIGLIVRKTEREMMVFANSIGSAQPLAGVRVQIISRTNQSMFTGTTGADGMVRFPRVDAMGEGFEPRMVVATLDGDYNFLDLNKTEVERYRFDLGGKAYTPLDAYAWSDRNLYRPGDTIHLACMVRDWEFGTPNGLPLMVKVRDPHGAVVETQKHLANKDGAFEAHCPTSLDAPTGEYSVDIYTASDEFLTSVSMYVEDFVPDKIRVQPSMLVGDYQKGDTVGVKVEAEYYFGAACDSHYYELRSVFVPAAYSSKQYKDFSFAAPQDQNFSPASVSGYLNRDGRDTVGVVVPNEWDAPGPLIVTSYATVHDNTGRTVTRKAQTTVDMQDHYLGMRVKNGYYMSMGAFLQAEFVAVDGQDKAAADYRVAVQIERQVWNSVLRSSGNGYHYESGNVADVVYADTLLLKGGSQAVNYRLDQPGVYILKAGRPGEGALLRTEVLVYGKGAEHNSSFGAEREGTIRITTDKAEYKSGESARVHFATPFSGRMLVTVEREKVYQYYLVNVPRNSTELYIPISDAHVPNVYLSATLFHPMRGAGVMPFTVSHGYTGIKVDQPGHNLNVKVTAPERVTPGKRCYATVKTVPNAYVTLAAVDEGILAIRNFKTPDPYPYLYAARELRVSAYDIYRYVLPEVSKPGPLTGGDAMGGYAGLNPFQIRRIRSVALWSGIIKTNGSGVAQVPLDFQAGFNGKVRLMAVAWSGRRCGAGESALKVHEDLVVNAALPRFIIAGDSIRVPIHALNTTDKNISAEIEVVAEGPIRLLGTTKLPVVTEGKGAARSSFFAVAGPNIGKAKVWIHTRSGKKTSSVVHEFAVYPPGQLEKTGGRGQLAAGQSTTLSFPGGFYPETQTVRLRASSFPAMEFGSHLRDLVTYPHGCVEQTVSKLFPQLYFGDLAQAVAPEAYGGNHAVSHIREGIKKLERMQAYDGSFAYWEGGPANDWVTCYAMHFLVEAQKAGYPVAADRMTQGLDYLRKHMTGDVKLHYTYSVGSKKVTADVAAKEWVYALYVLALAGQADKPMMNFYKSHPEQLAGDSRYMLAAAFAVSGDPESFQKLMPARWMPETTERQTGGTMDSEIRPSAIALCALLDADPSHPFIPTIVAYLANNADQFYSTQDKAWAFLGLGKAAKGQAQQNIRMEVVHNGQVLASGDGSGVKLDHHQLSGQSVTFKVSGTGKAYYFWETEGVPKQAGTVSRMADKGMRLKRSFFDTEGRELIRPVFKQGELIVCRMVLRPEQDIENIALTDLLPAGMEVENQRVGGGSYPWIKGEVSTVDYQDIKDRGLVTYLKGKRGEALKVHYLLRAVNPGRFQLPPAQAEAMYDPRLRASASGMVIEILPANAVLPSRTAAPRQGALAAKDGENKLIHWWRDAVSQARAR